MVAPSTHSKYGTHVSTHVTTFYLLKVKCLTMTIVMFHMVNLSDKKLPFSKLVSP